MDEQIKFRVGRRVRALREQAGLSQDRLAHLAKMSRVFLGDVERGESSPSLETLDKIAEVLRVEVTELVSAGRLSAAAKNPGATAPEKLGRRVGVLARGAPDAELRRFEKVAALFFARYRPQRSSGRAKKSS